MDIHVIRMHLASPSFALACIVTGEAFPSCVADDVMPLGCRIVFRSPHSFYYAIREKSDVQGCVYYGYVEDDRSQCYVMEWTRTDVEVEVSPDIRRQMTESLGSFRRAETAHRILEVLRSPAPDREKITLIQELNKQRHVASYDWTQLRRPHRAEAIMRQVAQDERRLHALAVRRREKSLRRLKQKHPQVHEALTRPHTAVEHLLCDHQRAGEIGFRRCHHVIIPVRFGPGLAVELLQALHQPYLDGRVATLTMERLLRRAQS